jgi:hypothetical protein
MLTISRFWQALQCAPKSNHGSFNRTLNTAGFKPWLSDSKSNRADESNSGELNNHTAHSHAALHHYARVPEDSALRPPAPVSCRIAPSLLPAPFEGKCAAAVSWRRPGKCRRPPASSRFRGVEEAAPSFAGPTTSHCRRPQRPRAFARSGAGEEGRRGFARARGRRRCARGGGGAPPRWIRKEEDEVTAPRPSCSSVAD